MNTYTSYTRIHHAHIHKSYKHEHIMHTNSTVLLCKGRMCVFWTCRSVNNSTNNSSTNIGGNSGSGLSSHTFLHPYTHTHSHISEFWEVLRAWETSAFRWSVPLCVQELLKQRSHWLYFRIIIGLVMLQKCRKLDYILQYVWRHEGCVCVCGYYPEFHRVRV